MLLLNFIVYCIVTYTFFPLLSISRRKIAFLLNFKPIFRYRLLPYRPWESVGGTGWQGDQSSPRFWKFQHKTLFSWFRVGKNKFHPFWPPPPWKLLEKCPSATTLEKTLSDAHAYCNMKDNAKYIVDFSFWAVFCWFLLLLQGCNAK